VIEAKFHGVPIIAIPFFGDQMANADVAVAAGWALKVDYKDMTEESLLTSINEVLNNRS
jgi:glucuronosyltransferase